MKILILAPSFPPIVSPQAIGTAKIARGLVEAGAEVTIVTRAVSAPGGDRSACWQSGLGELVRLPPPWPSRRLANRWVKLRRLDGMASWFLDRGFERARSLLRERPFDVLLTRVPQGDALFAAQRLREEFGVPWATFMSDPFPDHLYPPPYGQGRSVTYVERLQHRRTREAVAHADFVLVPCRRLGTYLQRVWEMSLGEKVNVVPHIGWASEPRRPAAGTLEILHAGGLGGQRASPDLFVAFGRALERFPGLRSRLRLTLLGEVHGNRARLFRDSGLEDVVRIEPAVPFEQALRRMAEATALLVIEARLREGIFLPSKFSDYAASGRPVLLFSPEQGTLADKVGGHAHPGFLGQDTARCTAVLEDLFQRLDEGADLSAYRCPDPQEYASERVIGGLLDRLAGGRRETAAPAPATLPAAGEQRPMG